tara:strand:+ start:19947 stop:20585 length:639 start_codon:yes stop_codon:yes gene_type:complete
MRTFISPTVAFEYYYDKISREGKMFQNTRALFNQGFYISNPQWNVIKTKYRKFNIDYANAEWEWYESADPSVKFIEQKAKMWGNYADENGEARSNYGWQWRREDQLDKVINILNEDNNSRRAVITLYDGKEINTYSKDTPCTLNLQFQIIENKLCMTAIMRSNDLWFGFCNDQYCFSKLQLLIANKLQIHTGWYFHFASNLHIYFKQLNRNK